MRVLLDTHVAIWAVLGDPRLPLSVADLLSDPFNQVAVSSISLAEIAIKWPLGRVREGGISFDAEEALGLFSEASFGLLDFRPSHAVALRSLPPVHRDPFDRMLICQALEEPMRLITHDAVVASYSDTIIHF